MMGRGVRAVVAVVMAALLLGAAACTQDGAGTGGNGQDADQNQSQGDNPQGGKGAGPQGSQDAVAQLQKRYQMVVQQVLTSVVLVRTKHGLGSGVVYDEQGHIVTNAHVVGKAEKMTVRLSNGQSSKASLVYSYPATDLAVLQLDQDVNVEPATFADSSKLQAGQIVLAMGNPLGLSGSVTQGIISALGRTVTEPPSEISSGTSIRNMVQTSAAINPGNSGGALVNLRGEVVGIPTLAATDPNLGQLANGIGFAIPSNTVTRIADDIIAHGEVTDSGRARLGIRAVTVTDDEGKPMGVGVAEVQQGTAADKAGLRRGDVIIELAGAKVRTTTQLQEKLVTLKPGSQVELEIRRDGDRKTVKIVLGEQN